MDTLKIRIRIITLMITENFLEKMKVMIKNRTILWLKINDIQNFQ